MIINDNNKGFTLVELVAVVAIMLTLATIATVAVTGTLKKSKGEISDVQEKLIESAAKAYYLENNGNGLITVKIDDLVSEGYLESNDEVSSISTNEIKVDKNGIYNINDDNDKRLKTAIFKNETIHESRDDNDDGLYVTDDNDGKTYYYRGSDSKNNVKLNNSSYRIYRINGDGTIRITAKNISFSNNTSNSFLDSDIKIKLDELYNEEYSTFKFVVNSKYCAEKRSVNEGISDNLKCNDLNEVLNLMIGLPNMQEIQLSYLKNTNSSSILTNTTLNYYTITKGDNNLIRFNPSKKEFEDKNSYSYILPFINLSSDVKITGGDGTSSKPYVIDMN